jgi:hypothetical protein
VSYEKVYADTQGMGDLPSKSRALFRRRGVARGQSNRGNAIMVRRLERSNTRSSGAFYAARNTHPLPRFGEGFGTGLPSPVFTPPLFPSQVTTLAGLEFSLRRPRWLRRLKPLKVLGKAAKIGAIVGAGLIVAPAAAGLVARAGFGAVKGVRLLTNVGAKVFTKVAGKTAINRLKWKEGAARAVAKRAASRVEAGKREAARVAAEQAADAALAPVPASMVASSHTEAADVAMTSGGPAIPDSSDEAPTQAGVVGGGNPAMVIGGLVIGGLLLASMAKRRRRGAA